MRRTFVYNDVVEISCNEGYTLSRGASRITCSNRANWRPKRGRCTKGIVLFSWKFGKMDLWWAEQEQLTWLWLSSPTRESTRSSSICGTKRPLSPRNHEINKLDVLPFLPPLIPVPKLKKASGGSRISQKGCASPGVAGRRMSPTCYLANVLLKATWK